MENNGTKGILSTEGFQSVNQETGSTNTQFYNEKTESGDDHLGIRHWPRLFQYLEEHFSFSASLLSIVGYVIIAAFGSMQNLGQYLGYIIFLCGILFVYNFDRKDKRWIYFFIATTFLLIGIIVFQNWHIISSNYRLVNKPFQIDAQVKEIPSTANKQSASTSQI